MILNLFIDLVNLTQMLMVSLRLLGSVTSLFG